MSNNNISDNFVLRHEILRNCWLAGTNKQKFLNQHNSQFIELFAVAECCDLLETEFRKNTREKRRNHLQSSSAIWCTTGNILRGLANIHAANVESLYEMARAQYFKSKSLLAIMRCPPDQHTSVVLDMLPMHNANHNIDAMSTDEFMHLFRNNNNAADEQTITLIERYHGPAIETNDDIHPFDEPLREFDGQSEDELYDHTDVMRNDSPKSNSFDAMHDALSSTMRSVDQPLFSCIGMPPEIDNIPPPEDDDITAGAEPHTSPMILTNSMILPFLPSVADVPIRRQRRKTRRLIVDAVKTIPDEELLESRKNKFTSCEPLCLYKPDTDVLSYAEALPRLQTMKLFAADRWLRPTYKQMTKANPIKEKFISSTHTAIVKGHRLWTLLGQNKATKIDESVDDSIMDAILGAGKSLSAEAHEAGGMSEILVVNSDDGAMNVGNRKRLANRSLASVEYAPSCHQIETSVMENEWSSLQHFDDIAMDNVSEHGSPSLSATPSPVPVGSPLHDLLVTAHIAQNTFVDAAINFTQEALDRFCDSIHLESLRGCYSELDTLKKMIWFWRHDVYPITMQQLNFNVPSRLMAAKTFAALLLLKKKQLIEISCGEQNEIVHIAKGEGLKGIIVF